MTARSQLRSTRLRSRALGAVLSLALALGANAARADDAGDLDELLSENVVSGASRATEVASDAPATTTTITAADMRRYGIRSIDEAINFLGMGLITQNPLHSVEVGGRGVLLTGDFGNHVLLVVDGHVFNEPWDGTAYFEQGAGIPIEIIDHIELVLGPGSVLYGGNAMFGIVNVVTKSAASYKGVHVIGEVGASPQQGLGGTFTSFAPGDLGTSYRLSTGIGHELTLFGKPAQITAQAELYRQNGPSFEWSKQTASNADGTATNFGSRSAAPGVWGGRTTEQYTTTVPSLYAHLVWGNITVAARVATYDRKTPYVNGFNQLLSDFDDPRSSELDRWVSLDVKHRGRINSKLTTLVRAYGDAYDYQQQMVSSEGSNCPVPTQGACLVEARGRSRWMGVELQANYDWLGDERITTMVGTDLRVRNLGGQTDAKEADSGAYVGTVGKRYLTEGVWAAYLQQRYSPLSTVHLNAGARYDVDPRGGDRLSPRAALAIGTWRGGVLKTIYSEAFRAPTFYEAFYQAAQQRPAPDLRSEGVRSLEATVEQKIGKHRFLMGAFRTWWHDMIFLQAVDENTYQYGNGASIDNYGYNARTEGAMGELRYGFSVTGAYSRRRIPDGTEALPAAPQLFGNARIAYTLPGALPTVALATSFVGKRPADRANDGNFAVVPYAPAEVDLRLTLSGYVPGLRGLSYRLSANYVTASHSPYVAGPTQTVDTSAPGPRPYAELAPVNRFTTFLTLQYDFSL
jgi:outer membrane receptor for ferrienterochelin and colicins